MSALFPDDSGGDSLPQSDRLEFLTPERGAVEQCRSPVLRRNVQKALNRGEAYHQLRRAVAYAHGRRFRVRSQHEQEFWNECARLIGNAVIYYNALILSEALGEFEQRGDLAAAEVLKHVSPVVWQHINFYGRYQFDEDFSPLDLERLRQQLSTEEVSRLYATG